VENARHGETDFSDAIPQYPPQSNIAPAESFAAMDSSRYPPTMHHSMPDNGGAYPQVMAHQQMAQQPSPLTMQMPQTPQSVSHGHPGQPPYGPPMSQYQSNDAMTNNGGQVVATPTSAVMQSPRLPQGPPAVLEVISRVDEATGRKYS